MSREHPSKHVEESTKRVKRTRPVSEIDPPILNESPAPKRVKRERKPTAKMQQLNDGAMKHSLDRPASKRALRPRKLTTKKQKDEEAKRLADEDDAMYWKHVDSDYIDWNAIGDHLP
jgi:hypothetical protein